MKSKNESVKELVDKIETLTGELGHVQLMEVCGTHTVSLFRSGVKSMLPKNLRLVSGPGCPVCVTTQGYIDTVLELSTKENVIICTYGDMVRVPGRNGSLEHSRADGADIRVLFSARDAIKIASENPDRPVVWLAVGFETTAPTTAVAILEADQLGLENFYILSGHKLAVPAMSALLSVGDVPIDGFLCPGHVSVIIGANAYRSIIEDYHKPCAIAGFEAIGMLQGIRSLLEQIDSGRPDIGNVYGVVVTAEGNTVARKHLYSVFEVADADWRAIGTIPASGLELKDKFKKFDALDRFGLEIGPDYDPPGCRCGEVIQGKTLPTECELFAGACTPNSPVGPCMVSSEGTCAAYYKYGRTR